MLVGTLYTINDHKIKENHTLVAKIEINQDHPIFNGHFPNHPVMPGVCLTNMITDTLSSYLNLELYLFEADFIKFIKLVIPDNTNALIVSAKILNREEDMIRVEASLSDEDTTYLKLKGNFKSRQL